MSQTKRGGSLGAVDVDFAELGELDVEVGGAELVYFGVAVRSLCAELVAWEVQNAEALRGIFLVEGFKLIVLWRETAPGGRIDYQEHLAFVFGESNRLAVGIGDKAESGQLVEVFLRQPQGIDVLLYGRVKHSLCAIISVVLILTVFLHVESLPIVKISVIFKQAPVVVIPEVI